MNAHHARQGDGAGGIRLLRRRSPAGEVMLPIITAHRISLHLSERTHSRCRDSGESFVRRRGHLDLTPAGMPCGFAAAEASEWLELRVPVTLLRPMAEGPLPGTVTSGMPVRHMLEDQPLTHLLLALDAEDRAGHPGGGPFVDALASAIAVRLRTIQGEHEPAQAEAAPARQIRRSLDFIESHLASALSIEQLAAVAGVSMSSLQRGFRAVTGEPVHRYVVRRRVEHARELLRRCELPASEVALAAGFSHQSHMARWMQRLLGVAPHQIRRTAAKAPMAKLSCEQGAAQPTGEVP